MVEGGIVKANKAEFTECFRVSWQTPYIMRLAFSAGIGGLLFGYDTGVISGALLYIREDFEIVGKKTWLKELIVSMAVAGAIIGAAIGGWMSDKFGRRKAMLAADVLFFFGAIVMAIAPAPWVIVLGRVFVGLGVGIASMTAPLYISEASPHRIRGALVSTNGLLITGGQFLSYCINLAFTRVPGTWRWMLGVGGVPALIQFVLMLSLPESPRWLYRNGRTDEARSILEKIYIHEEEVEREMQALKKSTAEEKDQQGSIGSGSVFSEIGKAWKSDVVRRGLYAGIAVQVAQQFVGINTVMYYSPTIIQLAGFASNSTAMALSLITSGLNAIGSIASICFVDRYGRRRLMILSMFGIISCLVALSIIFSQAAATAPMVSSEASTNFSANATCQAYAQAPDASSWNCMKCLHHSTDCAFCSTGGSAVGACVASTSELRGVCRADKRTWYSEGCPSKIGFLAVILMGFYIILYSPGMGSVPWIINSEIYPLRFRGLGGGLAAMANWTSNLIVSMSFLSMIESFGSSGTFLLFAGFSSLGLLAIFFLVPETKGLQFNEVESLLQKGYSPFKKNDSSNDDDRS